MAKFLRNLTFLISLIYIISCTENVDDFYINLTDSQNKSYIHSLISDGISSQLYNYQTDKQILVSSNGISLIFEPNSITDVNDQPFNGKIKVKFNDLLDDAADVLISPSLRIDNHIHKASRLIHIQVSGQDGQLLKLTKNMKVFLDVEATDNDLWTTYEYIAGHSLISFKEQKPVTYQTIQNESLIDVKGLLLETKELSTTVAFSHNEPNPVYRQTTISANIQNFDSRIKNMLVLYRSEDGTIVVPLEHKSQGLFKSDAIYFDQNSNGHVIALRHNGNEDYDVNLTSIGLTATLNHVELNMSPMTLKDIKGLFKSL